LPSPSTLRRLTVVIFFAAVATAAQAAPATVEIGDLILHYDDAVWDVLDGARAMIQPVTDAPVVVYFRCKAGDCGEGTLVAATAAPADDTSPLAAEIELMQSYDTRPLWGDDQAGREINGLTVVAAVTFSGCRAMSPSELKAAVEHAGRRYSFVSGTAFGCKGLWSVGDEAFLDLISGLRPAR
jgi:hypothetical protein